MNLRFRLRAEMVCLSQALLSGLGCAGSVAAEFALAVPTVLLIAAGMADFGLLATRSAELVATTRIGAEYARSRPTDPSAIQDSMRGAMNAAPALGFPASFPQSCECDDGTPIPCAQSCATAGRPAPNRVFVRVSAKQAFSPLLPWTGIPETLSATTELRLQ
jgi:hypothetical protein